MTQGSGSVGEPPNLIRLTDEIRRLRDKAGLSQSQLAVQSGYSKQYISRAENPQRGLPSAELVRALDNALDARGDLIALRAMAKDEQQARRSQHQHAVVDRVNSSAATLVSQDDSTPRGVVDVNRKQFLGGLMATVAAPAFVISGISRARVSETDVTRYKADLARLYALDDHYGASGEVYGLTVRSMRHLLRTLEHVSYTPSVGDELRSVAGQLMEHAGWLAFDAGQPHDARYWWLEALHAARMAADVDTEVVVLASMSLAASRDGRGREAVDLACAASRVAAPRLTPRLRSILAAREALGHARAGNRTDATKALGHAHAELEHGRCDDDPTWLDFWGASDLAAHVTQTVSYLGELPAAERSARDALATVDPSSHPRNHALYQARYAAALVSRRKVDEALPVLTSAAVAAADLNSHRLTSDVETILGDLVNSHSDVDAVQELSAWTTTNLSTSTHWPTTL